MDDQPQPLTMGRVTDLLEEKDITYFFDQEGDVTTAPCRSSACKAPSAQT